MKYLIAFFISTLVGCGGSGGSSAGSAAPTQTPTTTAKSVYSLWTSDTDHEKWDLTAFEATASVADYYWIASDSTTCGFAANPNYALNTTFGTTSTDHYYLAMAVVGTPSGFGIDLNGQCGVYNQGVQGPYYNSRIEITKTDNQIQICDQSFSGCKTFH